MRDKSTPGSPGSSFLHQGDLGRCTHQPPIGPHQEFDRARECRSCAAPAQGTDHSSLTSRLVPRRMTRKLHGKCRTVARLTTHADGATHRRAHVAYNPKAYSKATTSIRV